MEKGQEIGKKIEEKKTCLAGVELLKQAKFKYFKPVYKEEDLPQWAKDLKEADLATVLCKDSKEGKKGLKEQEKWWEDKQRGQSMLPLSFY